MFGAAEPMHIEPNEVYTTKEVAELLKVSLPTIKRMLKDKRLKSTRIGKQHRFLGRDLLDMLSPDGAQPLTGPMAMPAHEAAPAPLPVRDAATTPPLREPQRGPVRGHESESMSTAEMRQRAYMLGKTLLRDIFDDDGSLLFEQGCVVTEDMIGTAKRRRRLMELFSNIEHDD